MAICEKNTPVVFWMSLLLLVLINLGGNVYAEQCGSQAGGALCDGGRLCCSQWGFCGDAAPYCGTGCQNGPCWGPPGPTPPSPTPPTPTPPSPGGGDVASIITESVFNELLKHRDDGACPAKGFYSYSAFIAAANSFPGFGTTGDDTTRRRELAAFFGQTSHETTGKPLNSGVNCAHCKIFKTESPLGHFFCVYLQAGGLRPRTDRKEQGNPPDYCQPSAQWPCASGKKYYGRGPIQLSWNYNYGPAGRAIGFDGINNPDIVATDPTISFKTAVWFWMTAQSPKPSCHDVITGRWTPSGSDIAAGRVPGYGMITNIINGGLECGRGPDSRQQDRIGFYKRYCDILRVSYGDNLDCNNQRPYTFALSAQPKIDDHLIQTVV